jgi:hypothetical protein
MSGTAASCSDDFEEAEENAAHRDAGGMVQIVDIIVQTR